MSVNQNLRCTNCGRSYPETNLPYRCQECGGVFYFSSALIYDGSQLEPGLPGIWRHRHFFPIPEQAPIVSLGEGNTPLEWREILNRSVAFKLEYQNPTGSFKDRGAAVLLSFLRSRGVETAVEDSSGNAGAAFAAYAREAGVGARVYIHDATSSPKRLQIEKYGAQVVRIMGPRSNASEAVLREVARGTCYASHAYLPQVVAGYATAAFECVEQMGEVPGTIISPVGQGNLLIGLMEGFRALKQSGMTQRIPVPVGVQALACAPLWAVHRYGSSGLGWVTESVTLAEGVRVRYPVRGDRLLGLLTEFRGQMIAVEEDSIIRGRDQLAGLGFSVEPTSAIVWQALQEISGTAADPILVVLTGAGFKSP